MEKQTLEKLNLVTELQQFIGTEYYYQHFLGRISMFLTDGTKYLAEQAQCYWLMDAILSHQTNQDLRQEPFQVWTLKRLKNDGWKLFATDGNDKKLVEQHIPFSDFPLSNMIIWYSDNVAMLPSEY